MSTNRKIAKAYSILVFAGILGYGLSMFKEMLGASYFGVSRAMDAYYAALTVPNLINAIVLSPFTIIFVPIFIKYKLESRDAANRLVSVISNITLIALFCASIAAFAFAAQVIKYVSPGLDAETSVNAVKMLRIISLSMFFGGAVNVLTGILNAFEHFFWPAISAMFVTLSTIFFILVFADKWGVFVIGWGLLVGTILQAVFLVPFAVKHGFKHYKTLDLDHPEIKRSLNLSLLFLIMAVVAGLNGVTNRFMASWLPGGSIAALAYADKLVQVPVNIFTGAIAAAIYPFLSAQAAGNRIEDIKDTVSMSIRMSGFIFIPMAVIMMVLARPTIELVFQRGAFDAAATELTSKIFVFYSLQLFSNYAVAIMQRLLFAFQCFKSIFKIVAAGVVLNLLLNFVFMKVMGPPACGIALATSLGTFLAAVMYFATLKKRISNLHGLAILKSLAGTTAISLAAGLTAFLAYKSLGGLPRVTLADRTLHLAAASSAGLAVFISVSSALKLEEFQKVYMLVKSKFDRNPA